MHGKLLIVVFLLHNTLLMLLSVGYLAALALFWTPQAAIDRRFTAEKRIGIVWSNVVVAVIAIANVINGYVAFKKESLVGFYAYMTLCVIGAIAPLATTFLIGINDNNNNNGPIYDENNSNDNNNNKNEAEAETLITVVNAFACTLFGSNFICFYNAFTMQYVIRTQKERETNLKRNKIAAGDDGGAEGEARRKEESLTEKDEPRYYHSMTETAVL